MGTLKSIFSHESESVVTLVQTPTTLVVAEFDTPEPGSLFSAAVLLKSFFLTLIDNWVRVLGQREMARIVKSCIQSLLKMVNSVMGMVGIAVVLYAMWLIWVWQKQMGESPFGDDTDGSAPWYVSFVYLDLFHLWLCFGC